MADQRQQQQLQLQREELGILDTTNVARHNQETTGRLDEHSMMLEDIDNKLNTIIHATTTIEETTSDTNTMVARVERISDSIQSGVENVSRQVKRGFSELSDKLQSCMNVSYFINNKLWCLAYVIQWFFMLVVWLHDLYISIFVTATGVASQLGASVPYIGGPISYIVKILSLCLFIFGGCLIYGFILSSAWGGDWGFEFFLGLFQKIFSAIIIFLFETMASFFKYTREVEYFRGFREIFSTVSGVTVGLPLKIIGCIFKFIYCYMMCKPGGGYLGPDCATCGPDLEVCIQSSVREAVAQHQQQQQTGSETQQTGGDGEDEDKKDIKEIEEIEDLIIKIRNKLQEKHENIYKDIKNDAESAVKELLKPLKEGETQFDQIINVGSTVVGNIFGSVLKQQVESTTTDSNIQEKNLVNPLKNASNLFAGIEKTITTISEIQEKNIDVKNYDLKKMQEIITSSKNKKDLVIKSPKLKNIITNIAKYALVKVPVGDVRRVSNVIAVVNDSTDTRSVNKQEPTKKQKAPKIPQARITIPSAPVTTVAPAAAGGGSRKKRRNTQTKKVKAKKTKKQKGKKAKNQKSKKVKKQKAKKQKNKKAKSKKAKVKAKKQK